MPAAGKLSQQPHNARVQKRAQDSCLQAWQVLDCYGGDSSPSGSGKQPPSVSFTTPPLVPSSQFSLQLGSLLTKYWEGKSRQGGPQWKAKNNGAAENTVKPELHSQ